MTLVVGASGNTGKLVVRKLLDLGEDVTIIIRSESGVAEEIRANKKTTTIVASLLDLADKELANHVKGCTAVVSCLGHNMNLKGIFGNPKKLVTDATRRLSDAIKSNNPTKPVKFILMNTTGNRNKDLNEKILFSQKIVMGLIRLLVPPQKDNENAADFLRIHYGKNNRNLEWVAVRPDNLIDNSEVTDYEIFPSPIRSAVFNPGITSRINVGDFMANLVTNNELWDKWKGQMPVIYNK